MLCYRTTFAENIMKCDVVTRKKLKKRVEDTLQFIQCKSDKEKAEDLAEKKRDEFAKPCK